MELKTLFFVIALAVAVLAFIPYFRGMFKGDTRPHSYTWLIWSITSAIGAAGVWHGGGGLPAIGFIISASLTFLTFLFSLRFGTQNITRGDSVALATCLVAVFFWVFLNDPVASVILGISIDIAGYWPTLRKSFLDPWGESLTSWILWILAPGFFLLALDTYNILTTAYYAPLIIINSIFVILFLVRRRTVAKPI